MRTPLLLSLATTVAPALAQTTVTTIALTPLAAITQSSAGGTYDGVAANTAIAGSPNNLFLSESQNVTGYQSATTICYPTMPYLGGIGVNFFERAYARGAATERADGAGLAAKSWTIPATAVGTMFHQFLPVTLQGSSLVFSASNGVRIDCVR